MSWHKKDTEYYDLCPYALLTDDGVIFENFWQGSKVYPKVFPIEVYPHFTLRGKAQYLSWKYEREEKHIDEEGEVTPEYWVWRQSIFDCKKPIRYPNSHKRRSTCKFSLWLNEDGTTEKLDYLSARKRIYCAEYIRLIRTTQSYMKILEHVEHGQNICIFEVDVPAKTKRGLHGKYVDNDGYCHVTKERLANLLNDTSEPFGHGLCIAKALLEDSGTTL